MSAATVAIYQIWYAIPVVEDRRRSLASKCVQRGVERPARPTTGMAKRAADVVCARMPAPEQRRYTLPPGAARLSLRRALDRFRGACGAADELVIVGAAVERPASAAGARRCLNGARTHAALAGRQARAGQGAPVSAIKAALEPWSCVLLARRRMRDQAVLASSVSRPIMNAGASRRAGCAAGLAAARTGVWLIVMGAA